MRAVWLLSLAVWGQADWPRPRLVLVARGLENPIGIESARDASGRLFVVEQAGRIRIIRNGALNPTPFLDIRSKIISGGERGLLGLAFPPDFAAKQYFYVNYTEGRGATQGDLRTVVARYRVNAANPNVADAGSEERILVFDQPYDNHNGGHLAFSPRDGMLYIGTGDGGSGGDPLNSGQTPSSLLGKMLRIDVESGAKPYSIPVSNPFRENAAYRPEIWATGLRNPWRYGFDRQTGDLWIADVGQGQREEVDFQPGTSSGGENYGWRLMEGTLCYNPSFNCNMTGLTQPAWEYGRQLGVSVTGGPVYRGKWLPWWNGTYLVGDYGSGRIWGIRREAAGFVTRELINLGSGFPISTFGEDDNGEVYVARHGGAGEIHRLVDARPGLRSEGVVNAASYEPGVVPGSLVTVFGAGVSGSSVLEQAASLPLPSELGGTSVWIEGLAAPIYAVASVGGSEQVNVQVPWEITGKQEVTVVVARGAERSEGVSVLAGAARPGVFTTDGVRGVVSFNATGRLVTPAEPARPGDLLVIWATGLGAVDNEPKTGYAAPRNPLARLRDQAEATVGGQAARVLFAGLAPDLVGVFQVNIEVPSAAGSGDVNLLVRVGGRNSAAVKLALR